MIACICKVCCLLNFAHDRGSSTEGWILIVHIVHTTVYITQLRFVMYDVHTQLSFASWCMYIIHNSATLRYV